MRLLTTPMFTACAAASVVLCASAHAVTPAETNAKAFVQTVSDQVIAALKDNSGRFEKRRDAFKNIFAQSADVPRMAQVAAGDAWRTADAAVQADYTATFRDYMAGSYARRFESYAGQSVTIGRLTDLGRKGILVETKIVREGAPATAIDWQLRAEADGTFKVLDVVAEQISMLMTHRTEFAALRGDGDLRALTAALKSRL